MSSDDLTAIKERIVTGFNSTTPVLRYSIDTTENADSVNSLLTDIKGNLDNDRNTSISAGNSVNTTYTFAYDGTQKHLTLLRIEYPRW